MHLITWGIVLVIALGVNYGALALWFWCDPQVHRNPSHLLPAGDAIPALLAGGMISYALLRAGTLGPLFGVWMCCYGLAHVAHRASLPRANYLLGWFYLFCGGVLFLRGNPSFLNPWPMGMIFFIGELLGGITLIRLDKQSGKGGPDGDR